MLAILECQFKPNLVDAGSIGCERTLWPHAPSRAASALRSFRTVTTRHGSSLSSVGHRSSTTGRTADGETGTDVSSRVADLFVSPPKLAVGVVRDDV